MNNKYNIGLTKSLNIGFELARGEFIARQDADDISFPERIEKELEFLKDHPEIGLVGTQYILIDKNGKEISKSNLPLTNDEVQKSLKNFNVLCHGSVMFRKKCIEKVSFYNENFKYAQDYELWLRIGKFFKIFNIPEYLYKLRITKDTITLSKGIEQRFYMELAKKANNSFKISKIENPEMYFSQKEKKEIIRMVYSQQFWMYILLNKKKHAFKLLLQLFHLNPSDIKKYVKMSVHLLPIRVLKILKKIKKYYKKGEK